MTYEPITGDGPRLESVFGLLAPDMENRLRNSVSLLGRRADEIARRVSGHVTGPDNAFVLTGEPGGSQSIEFRYEVFAPGRGEVTWTIALVPISAPHGGRTPERWDVFVTVDVAVLPPTGDGEPRAVFNYCLSALSPDQAVTKLGDAVTKLDQLAVRPASDWLARGEAAGA